jgi:predicted metal-dependent phosphoesterase TrpH
MTLSRTTLHVCDRGGIPPASAGARAGVSLHSHSEYSKEALDFIPGIARRIPLVSRFFDLAVARYQHQHGRPLDFASCYWRPPLSPAAVIDSERAQIAGRFDLPALVSLTDHDTIEGPKRLLATGALETPLSVEWTVHVEEAEFHLGVHNIDPSCVEAAERAMAALTAGRRDRELGDILDWLAETPSTFVVLNHPFWDMAGIGALKHEATLLRFMRAHRHRVHGLEINGYRMWSENRRVLPLAEGFGIPVVAGGDRHGRLPNAVVNLTPAATLAEFADDLRAGRRTDCVVFPEYWDPFAARLLQGARDALGYDRHHHAGRKAWSDRVFFQSERGEAAVSSIWPDGAPLWLRSSVAITRLLGAPSWRPLYRLAMSGETSLG